MVTEQRDVHLDFFTRLDLRERQIARQLLELLYHQGRALAPEFFDNGKRLVPVDATDLDTLVERWPSFDTITMRRETQYVSELAVTTLAIASRPNNVTIWVEEGYFRLRSRTEDFLQLSIALYDLLDPLYGSIHQTRDAIEMATVHDPRYGRTVVPVDLSKVLPGIFWANFLGPAYVELIGRGTLLTAPCEDVREMSDGGLLIITSPSPLEPSAETNRSRRHAVRAHLGEDYFYRWM